jgi:hypothetical protein
MSDEESFREEIDQLVQRITDAETSNFIELSKIAELNLKEDLAGVDLSGFDLSNADLSHADLSNTKFVGANLCGANLSFSNLNCADFTRAILTNANLSDSKMNQANFAEANFCGADLFGTNLLDANLSNAIFKGARIDHNYLLGAKLVVTYLSYASSNSISDLSNVRRLIAASGTDDRDDTVFKNLGNFVTDHAQSSSASEFGNSPNLFREYLDKAENLDTVDLVFTYRYEIEEIEQSFKDCREASIWLSNEREALIKDAEESVTRFKSPPEKVKFSTEQLRLFCESIRIYLLWLEFHIAEGSVPTPLPPEIITLALPSSYYMKAFELIRDTKFLPEYGLSHEAATELTGYFNRFLIKPLLQSNSIDF